MLCNSLCKRSSTGAGSLEPTVRAAAEDTPSHGGGAGVAGAARRGLT